MNIKKWLVSLTFIAVFMPVVSFAHWLPKTETFVGGVGPGCTLGYVASIYGQPAEKRWFNTDGVRGVTYVYSPYFSITGRTGSKTQRAETDLIVVGYTLKNSYLSTPSGLTVGIPFATVKGMYGWPDYTLRERGEVVYGYNFHDTFGSMAFHVDGNGVITELYYGTDW